VKAWIKIYADRIDAATLRERVLIFGAATALLVYLASAMVLDPLRAKQKRFAAETAQKQAEIQGVQIELVRLSGTLLVDPDAENHARRAALRAELAELDARVAEEQRRFTPPERMRAVLEEMLQRNKGVTIVELRSLPVVPIGAPRPGAAAAGGLYRHGIELTLSGTYIELYDYLHALERLPTQLYWRQLEFSVAEHPVVVLKLTVYTVSFDQAWLIV
jgi:MSHA biogenesis protein MshJ